MVLEVRADALAETRFTAESLEPADGQALLRVERFGCTANNVTYGLLADTLGFGKFFPAPAGWIRVPAWGIAEVAETRTPAVREGERFFGYFPMATDVLLTPRAAPFGIVDAADHRASLMPAYNAYRHPDADGEDEQILLRPLFLLAFLLDESLAVRDLDHVVLSSASSKTASAIAFLLASRGRTVTGLTSSRNERFVRSLGVYDDVATYDAIDALPLKAVAFIDVAGDQHVRQQVHEHFRDDLVYSGLVGATHLDAGAFTAAPTLEHGRRLSLSRRTRSCVSACAPPVRLASTRTSPTRGRATSPGRAAGSPSATPPDPKRFATRSSTSSADMSRRTRPTS